MMKKILSTIVLILLTGYVVFATIALTGKPKKQVCQGIRLEIRDSIETGYMNTSDIVALLEKKGLDPTGQLLDEVSLRTMEEALEASPLIRSSECHKTISGHIAVEVECRRPILHIITDRGESYYLDEEGEIIDHIAKAVYLPMATGHITRKFAQQELLALAQYLQSDELWNAQVEQIHVTQRGDIELTPRVGDHTILLGRPGNYEHKFDKLRAFYKKGLNEVGWNRYSYINIDHTDQVVATKR